MLHIKKILSFSSIILFAGSFSVVASSCSDAYSLNISGPEVVTGVIGQQVENQKFTVEFSNNHHHTTINDLKFSAEGLPLGLQVSNNYDGSCNVTGVVTSGLSTQNLTGEAILCVTDDQQTAKRNFTYNFGPTPLLNHLVIKGAFPIEGEIFKPITPLNLTCENNGKQDKTAEFSIAQLNDDLPTWLNLTNDPTNGTATISGTPDQVKKGSFEVLVKAHGDTSSAFVNYDISPSPDALITIEGARTVYGNVGAEIAQVNLRAADVEGNTCVATFSIVNGSFPEGIILTDLQDGTATITGTPTTQGYGTVLIKAFIQNQNIQDIVAINYNVGPNIVTDHLHIWGGTNIYGISGIEIKPIELEAKNDDGELLPGTTFSVYSGALPFGLQLTTNTDGSATITGTPTIVGSGNVVIQATHDNLSDQINISWNIREIEALVTIDGAHNIIHFINQDIQPISLDCKGANGQHFDDAHFYIKGNLPTGLTAQKNSQGLFVISGQVATECEGSFQVAVNLDSEDSHTSLDTVTINYMFVSSQEVPPTVIFGAKNIYSNVGTKFGATDMMLFAYDEHYTKQTGITWSKLSGSLPAGLTLKSDTNPNSSTYGGCWLEGTFLAAGTGSLQISVNRDSIRLDVITINWKIKQPASAIGLVGPTNIHINMDGQTEHSTYQLVDSTGRQVKAVGYTIDDINFDHQNLNYEAIASGYIFTISAKFIGNPANASHATSLTLIAHLINGETIQIVIHYDWADPHVHPISLDNDAYLGGTVNGSTISVPYGWGQDSEAEIKSLRIKIINQDKILNDLSSHGGYRMFAHAISLTDYDVIESDNWFDLHILVTISSTIGISDNSFSVDNQDYHFGDYSKGTDVRAQSWMNANVSPAHAGKAWFTFYNTKKPPSQYKNFIDWMNYTYICTNDEPGNQNPSFFIVTDSTRSLQTVWDLGVIYGAVDHDHGYADPNIW